MAETLKSQRCPDIGDKDRTLSRQPPKPIDGVIPEQKANFIRRGFEDAQPGHGPDEPVQRAGRAGPGGKRR